MTFAIISTSAVRRPSLGGNTWGGGGSSDDAAGCCSCCCLRFRVATSPDIICILELCEEGSQATRPAATAAGSGAGGPLLSCHSQWPPRPAPPRPPYPVLYMYLFLHAPLALARSLPYVCVCACVYIHVHAQLYRFGAFYSHRAAATDNPTTTQAPPTANPAQDHPQQQCKTSAFQLTPPDTQTNVEGKGLRTAPPFCDHPLEKTNNPSHPPTQHPRTPLPPPPIHCSSSHLILP